MNMHLYYYSLLLFYRTSFKLRKQFVMFYSELIAENKTQEKNFFSLEY